MKKLLQSIKNYFDLQSRRHEREITDQAVVFKGVCDPKIYTSYSLSGEAAVDMWDHIRSFTGNESLPVKVPKGMTAEFIMQGQNEFDVLRVLRKGSDNHTEYKYKDTVVPEGQKAYVVVLLPKGRLSMRFVNSPDGASGPSQKLKR
tara:strand:+ start:134 stop:571 length:438 start_codon:yes stop_codon:yes gene_type:complete